MSATTSTFLNVLRLGAAFLVFVTHCAQFWFPAVYQSMARLGHDAVIIFFVLSGFVIAHATARQKDFRSYAIARLSRLYSVVMPALALTIILQTIGTALNADYYQGSSRGSDALRYGISALFLQETWTFSASPPTNSPLWSLGYEFWYYAIFGAAIFIRPLPWRITAVTLLMLVVGPKVLLLMPIWIAGVAAYRFRCAPLPPNAARMLFVICIIILPVVFGLREFPSPLGSAPLFFSAAFLSDWTSGFLVALALFCFERGFANVSISPAAQHYAQRAADCTFSLYLYHYPLVLFATAVASLDRLPVAYAVGSAVAILALIAGLSSITETRRNAWRRGFECLWDAAEVTGRRAGTRLAAVFAASRVP